MLTSEAPSAIHWLEELGVEFTRENGGYRLARCGGRRASGCCRSATAPVTRSRRRCARRSRRRRHGLPEVARCVALEPHENGWRATLRRARSVDAGAVVLAAGGRCFGEAEERGELSTNHPGATGEVTQLALGLGAEARDLDALQYHPNGGAWPPKMQGYSIPETTRAYGAVLLNADGEEFTDSLGPRDAVSQAIFDEVEDGQGRRDAGRPARRAARHDARSPRPTPRSRCRTCSGATVAAASTRCASRSSPIPSSTTRTAGS